MSDSKHELLEQPDQGYAVNNSKTMVETTSNNKTPDQYLKKGEKARIFSIKKYVSLVQNRLCFTFFFRRIRLYQISIWHAVYLYYKCLTTTKCSKIKLASPHSISICRLLYQYYSIIFTIKWGWANYTLFCKTKLKTDLDAFKINQ